jgi:hypothetical protein
MAQARQIDDLEGAVRFLGQSSTESEGGSSGWVKLPWDLLAGDYLRFARSDLRQGFRRGRVNALGNAKRALHCRVDSVLFSFGYWGQVEDWNFNRKQDILTELGVVAPGVLRRANQLRNKVEHEYSDPSDVDQLQDLIDAVDLFLAGTEPVASMRYSQLSFVQRGSARGLTVDFDGRPQLLARPSGADGKFLGSIETQGFEEFHSLQSAVFKAAKRDGSIF